MSYFDPNLQQRISERLANLFTPINRIDRILNVIVKEVMEHKVVPYFSDVITRHSEKEFHEKIAQGFDLVEDMRNNHPDIFWAFMKVARRFKNRLVFNEGVMSDMVIDIVQSPPYNWFITADEHAKLFGMVSRLKMEIYS
jgi:hypothetical protein